MKQLREVPRMQKNTISYNAIKNCHNLNDYFNDYKDDPNEENNTKRG